MLRSGQISVRGRPIAFSTPIGVLQNDEYLIATINCINLNATTTHMRRVFNFSLGASGQNRLRKQAIVQGREWQGR